MKEFLGMLSSLLSSSEESYGKALENYIVSRNPQNTCDVERFIIDFDRKYIKGFI